MLLESIVIAIGIKIGFEVKHPNRIRIFISIISFCISFIGIGAIQNYEQVEEEKETKSIYDDGYSAGYDAGYYDGFSEAKETAYKEGYDAAVSELNEIFSDQIEEEQKEIAESKTQIDYEKIGEKANEELKKKLLEIDWYGIQNNSYDKGKKLGEWLKEATD